VIEPKGTMSQAKSNLLMAAEWLWSHRGKEMFWQPGVLTKINPDPTAPKLGVVEAAGIFETLQERQLIFSTLVDSRMVYFLNDNKTAEWNTFLSELRNEGKIDQEAIPLMKKSSAGKSVSHQSSQSRGFDSNG
jgi:hypothetical protein